MTICQVYIGDLEDPKFHWEGGDWNGNAPRALSSYFPPISGHYNEKYRGWIHSQRLKARQTDFGAWVARVSKAKIVEFIAAAYAGDEDKPWVQEELNALKLFVEELDDEKEYGLVALEF
jgi:hypothetical protein